MLTKKTLQTYALTYTLQLLIHIKSENLSLTYDVKENISVLHKRRKTNQITLCL